MPKEIEVIHVENQAEVKNELTLKIDRKLFLRLQEMAQEQRLTPSQLALDLLSKELMGSDTLAARVAEIEKRLKIA